MAETKYNLLEVYFEWPKWTDFLIYIPTYYLISKHSLRKVYAVVGPDRHCCIHFIPTQPTKRLQIVWLSIMSSVQVISSEYRRISIGLCPLWVGYGTCYEPANQKLKVCLTKVENFQSRITDFDNTNLTATIIWSFSYIESCGRDVLEQY